MIMGSNDESIVKRKTQAACPVKSNTKHLLAANPNAHCAITAQMSDAFILIMLRLAFAILLDDPLCHRNMWQLNPADR